MWAPPAATEANVPYSVVGISSSWPEESSPQQARVPSAAIAQVCLPPEETAWNSPVGIWSGWVAASSPQQARVPSAAIAQVCLSPAETAMNWPLGASLTWPEESSPQQARSPPTSTAQVWVPPAEIEGVESSAGATEAEDSAMTSVAESSENRASRRTVPLNPSFHSGHSASGDPTNTCSALE